MARIGIKLFESERTIFYNKDTKRINQRANIQQYHGDYDALSTKYNNRVTIKEGTCYIGQPYSGYAVKRDSDHECVILGVLIRKETFFWKYLSALSADSSMLNFFLEPQKNKYAEELVHLEIPFSSRACEKKSVSNTKRVFYDKIKIIGGLIYYG